MRGKAKILPYAAAAAVFVSSSVFAFSASAFAQAEVVTTQELIEHAEDYDGRRVVIEGEAVGDIMRRGEMAWITVNDDAYSERSLEEGGELAGISNSGIGVWLRAEEAGKIRVLGGYKNRGDRVRVTGTFHRADHENGGDMDIRGVSLEVIEPGYPLAHPVHAWEMALAFALAGLVLILGRAWRKRVRAP